MNMKGLSREYLKEIVHYEPSTGIFTYKENKVKKTKIGKVAGNVDTKGYLSFMINGVRYRNHRLAFLYMFGSVPSIVDHINNNRLDNRIKNLRGATQSQNIMNSPIKSNNTSGVKGVSFCKRENKWRAFITVNRAFISLGYFESKELAFKARQKAECKLFGEFSNVRSK